VLWISAPAGLVVIDAGRTLSEARQAREEIRTDSKGFYALTRQLHSDDYPATMTVPDHVLQPNKPVTIGGLRLATAEFGPDETHTATVFYEPSSRSLFAGDLVANRMTPALLEEHTCGWLSDLHQLRKRFPHVGKVYPGHGAPGLPRLIGECRHTTGQQFSWL
jgi:glyoxylase-like metal-dependent hydrolase (beta-lactamase superfamily II)